MLDGVNPKMNFWEIYPLFKEISIFKKLYKGDTSRLKNKTSKIMWGIAMAEHPRSDLYNVSNKRELIKKDIIKFKEFEWDDYEEHIILFIDMVTTQAEKSLISWNNRIKKRDQFLEEQEYTFGYEVLDQDGALLRKFGGNTKELDTMLSNTAKIYNEYFQIKKELEKDDIKRGKANKPKSATDAGEI